MTTSEPKNANWKRKSSANDERELREPEKPISVLQNPVLDRKTLVPRRLVKADLAWVDSQSCLRELADDPEMLQMLQKDPSLIMKLTEIMQNPSNIMKHMGDPAVQKLIGKLGSRFGAGPPGGFSSGSAFPEEDVPADSGSAPTTGSDAPAEPTFTAKKAPEPDLD